MPERASIFQNVQIGVETTPGTGVAANKQLLSLGFDPTVKANVKQYRPRGMKYPTMTELGKEWVEAKISGGLTYNEIVYVLSSILTTVSPTGAGSAKTWTFSPSSTAADTPKTFTVEQGDAVRAHKWANGIVTALELGFSREECSIDGAMMGKALQDGITMTATPTAITLVPVLPTQVSVYAADTQAGLAGAAELDRVLDAKFSIGDRFAPLWVLKRSVSSFATHVETKPALEMSLKVEADSAGMAYLATMRTGATKFLRIQALGAEITTGVYYTLQIDMAGKVMEPKDFEDADGVYAIEFPFLGVHDATWGKALEVTAINTVASL